MISSADISYGGSIFTGHGINYGQDIICRGKPEPIGWLETRYNGRLKPLTEIYQFIIDRMPPESFYYYEAEDSGWFYVCFKSLEDFIAGYNTLIAD